VPGNWSSFQAVSLNNHGHVAFNVYTSGTTHPDPGRRSFIWKDGVFKTLISKNEWKHVTDQCIDNAVSIEYMDDDENMVLTFFSWGFRHQPYFISKAKDIFAPCPRCDYLRNGFPMSRGCTPGKRKWDRQGRLYFTRGVEIRKLLRDQYPYYNITHAEIEDQNSRGCAIGTLDTILSGNHAFLAIPEEK
jgi:hypothetical protein